MKRILVILVILFVSGQALGSIMTAIVGVLKSEGIANPCGTGTQDDDPYAGTCWDPGECAGQTRGDATCDGSVNLADVFAFKSHFGRSAPWPDNYCCSDFNHDGRVDLGDLFILKKNFGTSGYVPSTGNQNCP